MGHGEDEGFSAGNLWGDAKALRVGKCGNRAGEGLDAAPGTAPSAPEGSPSAQGRCSPFGAGPSPPLGAAEIWGMGPLGCLGDPQGGDEAAQAEPRVSRPRDARAKTFPAWNFTGFSHGSSEDKPGGSPPVSSGAAGGSWQLLVAPGSSSARSRSHRAPASPPCPSAPRGSGGGSAAAAASLALGVGRGFTSQERGSSSGRDEERGRSSCPGAPAAPGAHGANPPNPLLLLLPPSPRCGISRSFLPTQSCCFSFSALRPYLETVAWRQIPASLMF